LALCDPPRRYSQAEVLERLGLAGDAFAEGIFERCGVRHRHLELDDELMASTLQGRTAHVEEQLFARSVCAVEKLDVDAREIGTVLSASLYSLGCPTLAHRLVDHFGMDPATDKYHLTGIGCASGVPLMRLAAQAIADHPGRRALVVAAESMSGILMRGASGERKAKIVGSAIFGDGCAAVLLSHGDGGDGPAILASEVHQIANTLGAVRLELEPHDSYLRMDRDLPDLARAGLPAVVDRFLRRHGLSGAAIDHWIVHPGGRRIIENVEVALALSDEQVQSSWHALAEHGNVGTPSILYVLADTIERATPRPGERGLVVTIGPGVTVGMMLLGW
jgi:alkylresorcinol/alkylpyrone synthase